MKVRGSDFVSGCVCVCCERECERVFVKICRQLSKRGEKEKMISV